MLQSVVRHTEDMPQSALRSLFHVHGLDNVSCGVIWWSLLPDWSAIFSEALYQHLDLPDPVSCQQTLTDLVLEKSCFANL